MRRAVCLVIWISCVALLFGCAAGASESIDDPWGLALSVSEISPAGGILLCEQRGGTPPGELQTGVDFSLEKKGENGWTPLEPVSEPIWTANALGIPLGETKRWPVDWTSLYGELPPGQYRIKKEFHAWRAPGDYDTREYYAEFTVR